MSERLLRAFGHRAGGLVEVPDFDQLDRRGNRLRRRRSNRVRPCRERELDPSWRPEHPVARFTVPEGWNAWQGPNRVDTIGDHPSNDEALGHRSWYAGLLILEVDQVAIRQCASQGWDGAGHGRAGAGDHPALGST